MHENYTREQQAAALITTQVKRNFKKLGYTEEQIARIEEQAKLAGLT